MTYACHIVYIKKLSSRTFTIRNSVFHLPQRLQSPLGRFGIGFAERMMVHNLKMNTAKCMFGVSAGNFLGFLVHQKGIVIDQNKAKAVMEARPPRNKKELQSLLGKINFLRRFIANSAGKMKAFSPLLKLKNAEELVWGPEQQEAFEQIKKALASPPVLVPPTPGKPLKLYIAAAEESIGCLLAQDAEDGTERAVYYLSQSLNDAETRYTPLEKLCLSLFHACTKLEYYLMPHEILVLCKIDIVRYLLNRPVLQGRLMMWAIKLTAFTLKYVPLKAVKGQALADFLAEHPCMEVEDPWVSPIACINLLPWVLTFDGSKTQKGVGAGVTITNPDGKVWRFAYRLNPGLTNNQVEYDAMIIGLKLLAMMGADYIHVKGDSQLVVKQLTKEYGGNNPNLLARHATADRLIHQFIDAKVSYIPRGANMEANDLAKEAFGYRDSLLTLEYDELPAKVMVVDQIDSWRKELIKYLQDPSKCTDPKIKREL